jgi:hypothetical protein
LISFKFESKNANTKVIELNVSTLCPCDFQGFEVYAKVLETPVTRTPVTSTASVAVSAPASVSVPVSVAKDIAIEVKTPEKSTKIDTPSPTSVTGNNLLVSHFKPYSEVMRYQTLLQLDLGPTESTPSHLFLSLNPLSLSPLEAIGEEPALDPTATHITTLFDSEDDWQVVTKKDFYDGNSSTESKGSSLGGTTVEAEDVEGPTEVESDLIDQIRVMFIEQSGRKATMLEEKEWLKNIRDVTETVEDEETTI